MQKTYRNILILIIVFHVIFISVMLKLVHDEYEQNERLRMTCGLPMFESCDHLRDAAYYCQGAAREYERLNCSPANITEYWFINDILPK